MWLLYIRLIFLVYNSTTLWLFIKQLRIRINIANAESYHRLIFMLSFRIRFINIKSSCTITPLMKLHLWLFHVKLRVYQLHIWVLFVKDRSCVLKRLEQLLIWFGIWHIFLMFRTLCFLSINLNGIVVIVSGNIGISGLLLKNHALFIDNTLFNQGLVGIFLFIESY